MDETNINEKYYNEPEFNVEEIYGLISQTLEWYTTNTSSSLDFEPKNITFDASNCFDFFSFHWQFIPCV